MRACESGRSGEAASLPRAALACGAPTLASSQGGGLEWLGGQGWGHQRPPARGMPPPPAPRDSPGEGVAERTGPRGIADKRAQSYLPQPQRHSV